MAGSGTKCLPPGKGTATEITSPGTSGPVLDPAKELASHLAHEEADALPLISQILSPGELGGIAAAIRGGHSTRRAGTTVPWALASPGIREHALSQLPAPARLLYRTVWLPRYARTTPPP